MVFMMVTIMLGSVVRYSALLPDVTMGLLEGWQRNIPRTYQVQCFVGAAVYIHTLKVSSNLTCLLDLDLYHFAYSITSKAVFTHPQASTTSAGLPEPSEVYSSLASPSRSSSP